MHERSLTPAELALVADGELFRSKERIIPQGARFAELRTGLEEDLARTTLLLPPGFDPAKSQSVKGEHLEQCPYQYLDYPKHFLGDDKFTFRTLCWWGHHLVLAMIVEGGQVKQCKRTSSTAFTSWPVMGWNCPGAHAVGMEARRRLHAADYP